MKSNSVIGGGGGAGGTGGTGTGTGGVAGAGGAGGGAQGGGIWVNTGDVTVTDSNVENNSATAGAGGRGGDGGDITGFVGTGADGGSGGNGGAAQGGGIWAGSGDVTIDGSSVSFNAVNAGAGGDGGNGGAGTAGGGTTGGDGGAGGDGGDSQGGGIFLGGGTLSLDQATISGNSAGTGTAGDGGNGGAGGDVTTNDGVGGAGGNGGSVQGGGIYTAAGAVVTITNSTIDNNLASNATNAGDGGDGGAGGGSANGGTGGNGGSVQGGGLYFTSGTLTITNSTISTNTAAGAGIGGLGAGTAADGTAGVAQGGGLFIAGGTAVIHNSTIADNMSDDEGGGIRNAAGATITLVSTLISGNTSANSTEGDLSNAGTIAATSNRNLVEDPDGHTLVNHVNGNLVGTDPMLDVLADNGGPTRTHALLSGSVAIDAGFNVDSLAFDQRGTGFPRTLGARTDIGAFETEGTTPFTIAAASIGGKQIVKVFDAATHALIKTITAFQNSAMKNVRVTTGDVNGDGVPDIIVAAGAGRPARIKVYDGKTFNLIRSFLAFGGGFTGGVFVAAGDVDGDGDDDIIVGRGAGGRPRVRVFDFENPGTLLLNFNAYPVGFSGGVRVASGDVTLDGFDDIITGAGTGA